jgi:L-fuculose-phosphate aldolase
VEREHANAGVLEHDPVVFRSDQDGIVFHGFSFAKAEAGPAPEEENTIGVFGRRNRMPSDRFRADRESVLLSSKRMWEDGLVVASAGNASARVSGGDAIAITPTSISYDVMTADQIVVVGLESGLPIDSTARPSGELPTHLAVYRHRPDVGAVVHTHAPYVSTLSVLRRPLPPIIDEMIVYFGGTVEVADYAFSGTGDLGANVVAALGDRAGVLLSNHGNLCVGTDLAEALHVALTMESTARIYVEALRTGVPVVLPEESLRAGRVMYEKRRGRLRSP